MNKASRIHNSINRFGTVNRTEEGDLRGAITIHVAQDVLFCYAIKLLKEFDEQLNTLYITKIQNNYYQVEISQQDVFVTKKTDFAEIDSVNKSSVEPS